MKHPLKRLADPMDFELIAHHFAGDFTSGCGRLVMPRYCVDRLLYLQRAKYGYAEILANSLLKKHYSQLFNSNTYLQSVLPINQSSLTSWGLHISEAGVSLLLAVPIDCTRAPGLFNSNGPRTNKCGQDHGLNLCKKQNREAPHMASQAGRYTHLKQYECIRAVIKTLHSTLGRYQRNEQLRLGKSPEQKQRKGKHLLQRDGRYLMQSNKVSSKLCALHAPDVACMSIGKARNSYELGVKGPLPTTLKEGLVMGMRSVTSNPYKGHKLDEPIGQISILANEHTPMVMVNRAISSRKYTRRRSSDQISDRT